MSILGIDIGGTKTSISVGTRKDGIIASQRIPTACGDSLQRYGACVRALGLAVMREAGLNPAQIEAIGISAPGPMDVKKGTLIEPPNNPGWRNVPIVKMVRDMFRRPVCFNNDANACALAEYHFGNHGVENLVYLTASTGMGGGIIANGKLIQGSTDTGGEVGHMVIDRQGPRCGCGQTACWEAFVGGKNVADQVRARIRKGKVKTDILARAGGKLKDIDFRCIRESAKAGDAFARSVWDEYVERMAQGIGGLIMVLNPDVVVLGTIAHHSGSFLMRPLKQKLPKYTWKWPLKACRIVTSPLGDRIGDYAALAVALAGLDEKSRKG